MTHHMKIGTLNIRGISAQRKQNFLWDFIIQNRLDILCLQEVNVLQMEPKYPEFDVITNANDKRGTAIIFKKTLNLKATHKSPEGRVIRAEFEHFVIVNVYAFPHNYKAETHKNFFNFTLPQYFRPSEERIVLLGDFNATIDKVDGGHISAPLKHLILGMKLKDAYTNVNRGKRTFTFKARGGQSRIDRIYVARGVTERLRKCDVIPYAESDHDAVVAEVDFQFPINEGQKTKQYASAYWKLNTSHLKDPEFIENFADFYEFCKEKKDLFDSPLEWWDYIKRNIKNFSIEFSQEKKKENDTLLQALQNQLSHVALDLDLNNGQYSYDDYIDLKKAVSDLVAKQFEGRAVRGRLTLPVEDEEISSAHLIQEQQRGETKLIERLVTPDGTTLIDEKEKAAYIKHHFTELFTLQPLADPDERPRFIENIPKRLSDEDASELTSPISTDEVKAVITSLKKNKSPGVDGIPNEFYQAFNDVIADDLAEVFNDMIGSGRMTVSQRTSLVSLIPKDGGDKTRIRDWRPISLLCSDYKILARVLVNRLRHLLAEILSQEQTGGLPGRQMAHNLVNVRNLIVQVNAETCNASHQVLNQPKAAVIGLDFAGAYDRVDRNLMYDTLTAYGFPVHTIDWIKTLYESSFARVILNGQIGDPFRFGRGVKQGCPLAMLCYVIYIESLILRFKRELTGVRISQATVKVGGHVDDQFLFVDTDEDIRRVWSIVGKFERCTNALINRSKTRLMGMGQWTGRQDWPFDWLKPSESIKVLGVIFKPNIKEAIEANTIMLQNRCNKTRYGVAKRALTVIQKVQLFNIYIASKFTHIARVMPLQDKFLDKIQMQYSHTVWSTRIERMAMQNTYRKLYEGGLGFVSLQLKCQALFTSVVLYQFMNDGPGTGFLDYWIGQRLRHIKRPAQGGHAQNLNRLLFDKAIEIILMLHKANPDRNWRNITPKELYEFLVGSTTPEPKIFTNPPVTNPKRALTNMLNPVLSPLEREHVFFTLHNLLPTRVRLLRCNRIPPPGTDICIECKLAPEDGYHVFLCVKSQPAVAWMRRKLIKLDSSVERLAIQEIFFLDFKLPDRKRHNTAVWLAANFSETLFKTRYSNSKNILRDVYTEMKRRIRRVVSSSTHESRLHHGEWSDLAGSDSDQSSNTWAA